MYIQFDAYTQLMPHLLSIMSSSLFISAIYFKDLFLKPLNPSIKVTQQYSNGQIDWEYASVLKEKQKRRMANMREDIQDQAQHLKYEEGELSEFQKLPKHYKEQILNQDNDEAKRRTVSVSLSCLLSITIVLGIFGQYNSTQHFGEQLEWLGLINFELGLWIMFKQVVMVVILNCCLFLGHLFQVFICWRSEYNIETKQNRNQRGLKNFPHFLWAKLIYWFFSLWQGKYEFMKIKSLFFAPLLEEILYRGLIFGIFRDCGYFESHPKKCIFLLPLYFSLAHAHQLWFKRNEKASVIKREILISIVKIIYTMIFGVYSGWAYYKTWNTLDKSLISKGNLWVPIMLHSHCNWFGLPKFQDMFDKTTYIPRKIAIAFFYLFGILLFVILRNRLM